MYDTGSSVNFVRESIVRKYGLKLEKLPYSVSVEMADGHKRHMTEGVYLHCNLGGYLTTVPCVVLPITTADVILGMKWSDALGPSKVDVNVHTRQITFKVSERKTFEWHPMLKSEIAAQ